MFLIPGRDTQTASYHSFNKVAYCSVFYSVLVLYFTSFYLSLQTV